MRAIETNQVRPVWAEISASRLAANFKAVKRVAGVDVIAVVKADAYGHGAPECSPVLVGAGARWLGVTSVEEGVRVRASLGMIPEFLQSRILVMCGVWNGEADVAVEHRLTPVVWEEYQLRLLESAAIKRGFSPKTFAVHVEVDTGMARQGVLDLKHFISLLADDSPLRIEGVMNHLASSEEAASPLNTLQMQRFHEQVTKSGSGFDIVHVGNTSAVDASITLAALKETAAAAGAEAMVRAGLALYGHALELDGGEPHLLPSLQPAMQWKTKVIGLRDVPAGSTVGYSATFTTDNATKLALLPVGYADGYRRELSNTGFVIIRGQRAKITGRVSMDLTIVDVTHIDDVAIGDEATLIGDGVSVEEQAAIAHTIMYEILCGISDRVPRIMVE